MAEKERKKRENGDRMAEFREALARYPLQPVFGRYDSLLHILLYVCVR